LKTEGEDYAFAAVETVYSEDPTHSCIGWWTTTMALIHATPAKIDGWCSLAID